MILAWGGAVAFRTRWRLELFPAKVRAGREVLSAPGRVEQSLGRLSQAREASPVGTGPVFGIFEGLLGKQRYLSRDVGGGSRTSQREAWV